DFDRYQQWLHDNGLSSSWIKRISGVLTAGAYITTDLDDNQITAFNPGAMAYEADLPVFDGNQGPALVLLAPGNKNDMLALAGRSRANQVPFLFDPGQSLNIWQGEELREAVAGACCFISNEYELSLFLKMTGWTLDRLYHEVEVIVTTQGPEGCILDLHGEKNLVPAAPVRQVCDPTGAGDAFRGGLLKGLALGLDWLSCCQMGSVAAAFAVEHYGTQEHRFDWSDFRGRFEKSFGPLQLAEDLQLASGNS
ncbi:MAG TPA: carbohydrate kinase family protein, partial [Syntrophobacteraceae bacterium]|nr:carbohydrate kinase family protein [Syntrophobacteraceae bacterium]